MRRTDDTRKKHDGPEGLIPSLSTSSPNRLIRVMDPLDPARERVPDGRLSSFRPAEGGNRAVFSFIVLLIGTGGDECDCAAVLVTNPNRSNLGGRPSWITGSLCLCFLTPPLSSRYLDTSSTPLSLALTVGSLDLDLRIFAPGIPFAPCRWPVFCLARGRRRAACRAEGSPARGAGNRSVPCLRRYPRSAASLKKRRKSARFSKTLPKHTTYGTKHHDAWPG